MTTLLDMYMINERWTNDAKLTLSFGYHEATIKMSVLEAAFKYQNYHIKNVNGYRVVLERTDWEER